jgi:hypothetical protein
MRPVPIPPVTGCWRKPPAVWGRGQGWEHGALPKLQHTGRGAEEIDDARTFNNGEEGAEHGGGCNSKQQ